MAYPNPADIPAMKEDPAVNLMSQEGLNIGYHALQHREEAVRRPRVRKALNMAVNKAAIIDAVFQGAGEAAKNPIPPTIWSLQQRDRGRSLRSGGRQEASGRGRRQLDSRPISGRCRCTRPYNPNAKRMAELIQADWKAVGVDAEIVSYEWGEYLKRSKPPASTRRCCWAGPATMAIPTTSCSRC